MSNKLHNLPTATSDPLSLLEDMASRVKAREDVEVVIVPRDKTRQPRKTAAPPPRPAKEDKVFEVVIEPNGKRTTGKARNYLERTIYKFYRWMTKHSEMKADVWQELEVALLEHDYPETAEGIKRAQATLKSRLYFLHKAHGIQPDAQGKLKQRYCQIANLHRFAAG